MDISFTASSITTNADNHKRVTVECSGVNGDDVLSQFSIKEIINYLGEEEILDTIGEKAVKDHFDLINNPE